MDRDLTGPGQERPAAPEQTGALHEVCNFCIAGRGEGCEPLGKAALVGGTTRPAPIGAPSRRCSVRCRACRSRPRRGRMRGVRYGMPVGGPLQAVGPLARAIEDRGFGSVWTGETTSSAFIQAARVPDATSQVRMGTALALGFPTTSAIP